MPGKSEFRIAISIITLILVLAISFSGFYLYKRLGINEPLQKKLQSIEGVDRVSLEQRGQTYNVSVHMKRVDNIQQAYQEINQAVSDSLPKHNYSLTLTDEPNHKLESFMQHMQPAIYESLSNNRFIWLDEEIARRTAEQGVSYKLFVDQEKLFIQLEDKDAYIYQVIDRSTETKAIETGQVS